MTHKSYQRAVLFALAATFLGASINAITKAVGSGLDPVTIIFFRGLLSLPLIWGYMIWAGKPPLMTLPILRRHAPRAFIGMASYLCLLFLIQKIPLANATAISLSQPFFVAFLAPLLLGEKLPTQRFWLIATGFIGVCFILKPDGNIPIYVALVGALHPLLYALAAIQIRHLSKQDDAHTILFFYLLISTVLTAPWAIWHIPHMDGRVWFLLISIALCGYVFQFCQNKTLELAEASAITPFNYLSLVWSILFAILFWGEWPDVWAWLGMGLIITMGLLLNVMARPRKLL